MDGEWKDKNKHSSVLSSASVFWMSIKKTGNKTTGIEYESPIYSTITDAVYRPVTYFHQRSTTSGNYQLSSGFD
jgi:hypothetical protein